jgi:hypothetical protein
MRGSRQVDLRWNIVDANFVHKSGAKSNKNDQ